MNDNYEDNLQMIINKINQLIKWQENKGDQKANNNFIKKLK